MSAVLAPKPTINPAEWALRVQLAAAYRVAAYLGWSELIYSHISMSVPGNEQHFLINPYGLRFDEVTASNLLKINVDGDLVEPGPYTANKAGFVIHSALHMARPDAQCVFHMHTLPGMAVSAQDQGLLPIHMYSHDYYERLSYHEYEGSSIRLGERERLVKSLGANHAMILRNHGLITVGRTIPEAWIRYWRLNRACEVQLAAQSAPLRFPSQEVCKQANALADEFLTDQGPMGELEFNALVRIVESKDASYKN
jgi:ribulose-5-phosphate 4-epimerase/fuculose-1-phosphate aldolase